MLTKQDLENNLRRVHEWTKSADQKISILMAFQGLYITALVAVLSKLYTKESTDLTTWQMLLVVGSIACLLLSFVKSLWALLPRLKSQEGKPSLTYFGDIAAITRDEFHQKIREATDELYMTDLTDQIYISSRIATTKHKHFRSSVILFVTTFALSLVLYFTIIT